MDIGILPNPIEEYSFRRGYAQGYARAVRVALNLLASMEKDAAYEKIAIHTQRLEQWVRSDCSKNSLPPQLH